MTRDLFEEKMFILRTFDARRGYTFCPAVSCSQRLLPRKPIVLNSQFTIDINTMSKTVTIPKEEYKKLKESVTISKAEYEEMLESIEILSDKEILKDIKDSKREIEEGKFTTLSDLKNEI
jgi:PHD/YefM family antitoxin component YafN of YafNO toxin-antitoxin module